jgi:osmotically-inducible protein OsmY
MKSNAELQKDVQDAIKWEPLLHAAEIGVTVNDGIVTLTGSVDSYTKKKEAESAAKKVAGVKAVAEEIEIKLSDSFTKKNDSEIAIEVVTALAHHWDIPSSKIRVQVEKGWVTLEGELNWNFQKDAAYDTVKYLFGVTGVTNRITIKSETHDAVEKKDIEDALRRNWAIESKDISVKVSGHKVILSGTVDSLYQKEEASRIAWKAPGIWMVDNELIVEYEYSIVD